jgi:hypothetical protein
MAIKKQLDVFERAALASKVHTGECLFIRDAAVAIATKVGPGAIASDDSYTYAYSFVVGGPIATSAVLYSDGDLSVTLTDASTIVVGGTIGTQTITSLITGSWNYFQLLFDGSGLTIRINDDSFNAPNESIHDIGSADRVISNLPKGSMVSGILSLWNTDVPSDADDGINLLYSNDVTLTDARSTFYPLIEDRTSSALFSWLFGLLRYDDGARWDDGALSTFNITSTDSVDVSYINPYTGEELTLFDAGPSSLNGNVSGGESAPAYSRSFTYLNTHEEYLGYEEFQSGRDAYLTTLDTPIEFAGDFAIEFKFVNLKMVDTPIAWDSAGDTFVARIEGGYLKLTFGGVETSYVSAYVGDAKRSIKFGRNGNKFKCWVDGSERGDFIIRAADITIPVTIDTFFKYEEANSPLNTVYALADALYDISIWLYEDGSSIYEPEYKWTGFGGNWDQSLTYNSPHEHSIDLTFVTGGSPASTRSNATNVSPIVNGDVPFNVDATGAVYPYKFGTTDDVNGDALFGEGNAKVYHIVPDTEGYIFKTNAPFNTITLNVYFYDAAITILSNTSGDVVSVDANGVISVAGLIEWVDENGITQSRSPAAVVVGGQFTTQLVSGWNHLALLFDPALPADEYKVKTTFSDLRIMETPVSLAVIRGINELEAL